MIARAKRRAALKLAACAALVLAACLPNRCFADCQYPDIARLVVAAPGSSEAKIVLVAAGETPPDFLAATKDALNNLARTDALLDRVATESLVGSESVATRYVQARGKDSALFVLDSEFMTGGSPK